MPDSKRIIITFPADILELLKATARDRRTTVAEYVRQSVYAAMRQEEPVHGGKGDFGDLGMLHFR